MVHLEEITRADVPVINAWRRDREVADRLGGAFRYVTLERDEDWFDSYKAAGGTQVRCGIHVDERSEPVGVVYLTDIDPVAKSAEFSIMIGASDSRGAGVGTEATKLMLDHAFGDLNLERVYLHVLADNEPALALYEKVGFVREGVLRHAAFKNGAYKDVVVMGILKGEWATRSS